jgi:hypothetical protein
MLRGRRPAAHFCSSHGIRTYPSVESASPNPADRRLVSVPSLRMVAVAEVVAVSPKWVRDLHVTHGAERELPEAIPMFRVWMRHLLHGEVMRAVPAAVRATVGHIDSSFIIAEQIDTWFPRRPFSGSELQRMTSAGGGRRRPRVGRSPLSDPSSGPHRPRSGLGGGLASRSRPAGSVVRARWTRARACRPARVAGEERAQR